MYTRRVSLFTCIFCLGLIFNSVQAAALFYSAIQPALSKRFTCLSSGLNTILHPLATWNALPETTKRKINVGTAVAVGAIGLGASALYLYKNGHANSDIPPASSSSSSSSSSSQSVYSTYFNVVQRPVVSAIRRASTYMYRLKADLEQALADRQAYLQRHILAAALYEGAAPDAAIFSHPQFHEISPNQGLGTPAEQPDRPFRNIFEERAQLAARAGDVTQMKACLLSEENRVSPDFAVQICIGEDDDKGKGSAYRFMSLFERYLQCENDGNNIAAVCDMLHKQYLLTFIENCIRDRKFIILKKLKNIGHLGIAHQSLHEIILRRNMVEPYLSFLLEDDFSTEEIDAIVHQVMRELGNTREIPAQQVDELLLPILRTYKRERSLESPRNDSAGNPGGSPTCSSSSSLSQ